MSLKGVSACSWCLRSLRHARRQTPGPHRRRPRPRWRAIRVGRAERAAESAELTVLAAASLTDAGAELEAAYEDANPGIDLTFSFDSSSALRGQVEAGAAADLFLSADARNPQTLEDAGLTTGDQVPFASNLLTIVVPSDNPGGVESWQDLADRGPADCGGRRGRPDPAVRRRGGRKPRRRDRCARRLRRRRRRKHRVARGQRAGGAGEDRAWRGRRRDRVRHRCHVVRGRRGDRDSRVANVPATYVGVALSTTEADEAGAAFLAWLIEDEAQAILADFGFAPPP